MTAAAIGMSATVERSEDDQERVRPPPVIAVPPTIAAAMPGRSRSLPRPNDDAAPPCAMIMTPATPEKNPDTANAMTLTRRLSMPEKMAPVSLSPTAVIVWPRRVRLSSTHRADGEHHREPEGRRQLRQRGAEQRDQHLRAALDVDGRRVADHERGGLQDAEGPEREREGRHLGVGDRSARSPRRSAWPARSRSRAPRARDCRASSPAPWPTGPPSRRSTGRCCRR